MVAIIVRADFYISRNETVILHYISYWIFCFCHNLFWRVGLRLKCDGTRAETRFLLSTNRTIPFKSAEASVQSTTGSRDVRISGSNAEYNNFRGSVKSTGYPLHSPVSPSIPLPCVTVCHHVSTWLYLCLSHFYVSNIFDIVPLLVPYCAVSVTGHVAVDAAR